MNSTLQINDTDEKTPRSAFDCVQPQPKRRHIALVEVGVLPGSNPLITRSQKKTYHICLLCSFWPPTYIYFAYALSQLSPTLMTKELWNDSDVPAATPRVAGGTIGWSDTLGIGTWGIDTGITSFAGFSISIEKYVFQRTDVHFH